MSKSKKNDLDKKLFMTFCQDPRGSTIQIVQGAHKFISLSIRGDLPTPKKSILIGIFREFSAEPIKDYVFNRIPKKMLLELALCILQDIITKGSARAKSLQLVVVKTSEGDKRVVIDEDNADDNEADTTAQLAARKIANAVFRLSDKNGISPDISLSIGNGEDPAYKPPDRQGYFTPVRRSLTREFNVCDSLFSLCQCATLTVYAMMHNFTREFHPEHRARLHKPQRLLWENPERRVILERNGQTMRH